MSDKPVTTSGHSGLIGTLKISVALLVILFAGLAILLVMDMISMEQFKSYLITVSMVILIAAFAGIIIAMLIRPEK